MAKKTNEQTPRLQVRLATPADVPALVELTGRIYSAEWGHSAEMLRSQQTHFPEGQFVVEYEGKVAGYCATFRIDEATALAPHTWTQITGGGMAARHNPVGDWLYGMEVVVHPDYRGMRIGQRLYQARKRLCTDLKLRGIVFGGRIPGLARNIQRYGSAEAYVQAVIEGKRRDLTLSFQLNNDFELIGLLRAYVASDHESLGYAAHLVWRNPRLLDQPDTPSPPSSQRLPDAVRVASVQYQQRRIKSFEEFATQVEYFTDIAADYNADFVTFPELITLQLLSIENTELSPVESIRKLSHYTPQVKELFSRLAVRYNINIIAGTHPTEQANGDIHNVCYVCLRDGSLHEREKLHPTPSERNVWNITGGESAATIPTDCGPIGVMICYDAVLHRRARGLPARALLRAGPRDREPVLRGDVRQRGQPARGQQLRHPVRPELHPHAQRFSVRPRRHRRRLHAEHRNRAVCRAAAGEPGPCTQRRCGAEPEGSPLRPVRNALAAASALTVMAQGLQ